MPGPSLGTNLGAVVDWSTAYPFVDLFKMSRPWFTQESGVWDSGEAHLLDLDQFGWVRGFTQDGSTAPFEHVATIVNTSELPLRDGLYVIDWKGEGSLEVAGGQIISQSNGRIVIDPGNGAIGINITSTDPNGTGDYIRDIRFYHQDDAALLEAGVVFNPAFIEKIEDFRALRFMDWMGTNHSQVDSWEDATPIGAAQQNVYANHGAGVSVDIMVALANQVGADPWFTIPHQADANYIRQLATYVRDHLDPNLVARFEYSNEVWNWGMQQAQWANQQSINAWGEVEGGWMQWYGVKAAEMANTVAEVFGSETGTRALNVFSTHSAWHGLEDYALDAPAHVARGGEPPREAPFHVYAIAPYFGASIGSTDMAAQVNTWISQGEAGIQAALNYIANGPASDSIAGLASTIAYHANEAGKLGWQLEAYEGGQHVVDLAGLFGGTEDPARTQFFTTLVSRPEMGEFYQRYFETWKNNGGGLMAQFSDIGPASRYGSWGLWESVYSGDNPRSLAVETFRDTVEAWWADSRPESVFDSEGSPVVQPGTITGTEANNALYGTAAADTIYGLGGHDRIYGRGDHDRIYGGDGNDRLFGGVGSDEVSGGTGDDTLRGEGGNDSLRGGGGNDRLGSSSGDDELTGGEGDDVFTFSLGEDTITDFEDGSAGDDVLEFSAVLWGGRALTVDQILGFADVEGGDILFDFGNGNTLRLQGTTNIAALAGDLVVI